MKQYLGLVFAGLFGCGTTNAPTAADAPIADASVAIDAATTIDAPGAIDAPATIDAPASVACDPLADNDFDNVGTAHTKSGTACGPDPTVGCYGVVSPTGSMFTCMPEAPGSESNTNGVTNAGTSMGCAPGYSLAFNSDANGGMLTACYAFCKPGDAYNGNPNAQAPNGMSPHGCNTTDAEGIFGTIPDGGAASNGEHCMYSWEFELDPTGSTVHESPTSNSVGFCFDHSKYQYDSNGDGMITAADAVIPPCAALPLHSATGMAATDFGCVSTTTGGISTTPHRHVIYVPGLPQFATSSSRGAAGSD